MSSRIESLVKAVVEAWAECRAWYGADSDLGRALDELARWQFDKSVCESEHPAALREIEKTAERGEGAKSAQSAEEKPVEPVPDTDTWSLILPDELLCASHVPTSVGTRLVIVGRDDSAGRAHLRHDKQPQPVTPQQPRCCECGAPVAMGNVCQKCMLKPGDSGVAEAPKQLRDESRDVWFLLDSSGYAYPQYVTNEQYSGYMSRPPEARNPKFASSYERYVPYSQLEAEQADVARLKAALNRDRTGLAAALERINRTCVGYRWIPEGEWGSYDYTQQTKETLRKEVGNCLDAIHDAATAAFKESGDVATRTIRNEPSDSELLDAILETAQNLGEESAMQQVWKAITERANR